MLDALPWLHDSNAWRTAGLIAAAIPQTAYILLYSTFPWRSSFLGRALFFKACMLGMLIYFALFSRFYDFGHNDVVFTVLYILLAAGIWFLFAAFLIVKCKGDEQERADRTPTDSVSGNEPVS